MIHPTGSGWCAGYLCQTECGMQGRHHSLLWRHNEPEGASNHQHHDCLLNRLFGHRSNKTSKLRVTGLCAGNSAETDEFPTQMASDAENVSIWWRHHGGNLSLYICCLISSISMIITYNNVLRLFQQKQSGWNSTLIKMGVTKNICSHSVCHTKGCEETLQACWLNRVIFHMPDDVSRLLLSYPNDL